MAVFVMNGKQVKCVPVAYDDIVAGGQYVHVVHTLAGAVASFGTTISLAPAGDIWLGEVTRFGNQQSDGSWDVVEVTGEGDFIPADKHLPYRVTYRVVSVDGVRV